MEAAEAGEVCGQWVYRPLWQEGLTEPRDEKLYWEHLHFLFGSSDLVPQTLRIQGKVMSRRETGSPLCFRQLQLSSGMLNGSGEWNSGVRGQM